MSRLRVASFAVIVALLGIIFAIGMAALESQHLPRGLSFAFSCGFAATILLAQYILGPILLDWIVRVVWCHPRSVNDDFSIWYSKTCKQFSIPEPRFGIIEDGAPNAFTYGHGPWDARVVVTRGVINMLTPQELKAVVAHELGHVKHHDFIMMTIVQGLVLVLYSLYRAARHSRSRNSLVTMIAAYTAYQLSYYISLLFSRLREYMADYASAQIMENANYLSTALVKIAYGLGKTAPVTQSAATAWQYGTQTSSPAPTLASAFGSRGGFLGMGPSQTQAQAAPANGSKISASSLGAFGIASTGAVRTAVTWMSNTGKVDPANFARAARWEFYNPWAKIAELTSTHPLTARRIKALQKMNRIWNVPNAFNLDRIQPATYTGFYRDILVLVLPLLIGIGAFALAKLASPASDSIFALLAGASALMVGRFIQVLITYPSGLLQRKVLHLLGEPNVSHVNAIPVVIEGEITGRLDPGIAWASDFILQDETGFIACIFRKPLGIWTFLFGWLEADDYVGKHVKIYGWYRRFTSPYIEVSIIDGGWGGKNRSYAKVWQLAISLLLAVAFGLFAYYCH